MKFRLWITFLLLLTTTACIGNATPTVDGTAAATKAPSASTTPASSAYPAPGSFPTQPFTGQSLYPDPKSGDTIFWEQAVALVINNEVAKVTQAQSLQVTLDLKDGRVLLTQEPQLDAIFNIIAQCGDPCRSIIQATE